MRVYVPELFRQRRSFDVLFTNALVYLKPREIREIVDLASRLCGQLHFWSSTSEDPENGDRYRVTLRPEAWWAQAFRSAGFVRTRSPYLWRSERRDAFEIRSRA